MALKGLLYQQNFASFLFNSAQLSDLPFTGVFSEFLVYIWIIFHNLLEFFHRAIMEPSWITLRVGSAKKQQGLALTVGVRIKLCWNLEKSSDIVTFRFELRFLAQIAYRSHKVCMRGKSSKKCDKVCYKVDYLGQFSHFWAPTGTLLSQFDSFLNACLAKVSLKI